MKSKGTDRWIRREDHPGRDDARTKRASTSHDAHPEGCDLYWHGVQRHLSSCRPVIVKEYNGGRAGRVRYGYDDCVFIKKHGDEW